MKRVSVTISTMVALFFVSAITALGQTTAPAPSTPAPATPPPAAAPSAGTPSIGEAQAVKVRGKISAIDKENHTVTLRGSKGHTLTIEVRDPAKLEVLKVGDGQPPGQACRHPTISAIALDRAIWLKGDGLRQIAALLAEQRDFDRLAKLSGVTRMGQGWDHSANQKT